MELKDLQGLIINKLKLLIKKNYKNQKFFCEKFGIADAQLSRYMAGKRVPPLDLLNRIANFSNIDISYFFNDESNSEILDEELFNQVFFFAYNLALENKLEVVGSYFLACYDLISTDVRKNNIDVETSFNNNKKLILKFVTKS
jgi:transcriptional regulator with XRE-family HTH domain